MFDRSFLLTCEGCLLLFFMLENQLIFNCTGTAFYGTIQLDASWLVCVSLFQRLVMAVSPRNTLHHAAYDYRTDCRTSS